MRKIAVTTTSFGKFDRAPLEILRKCGFKVEVNSLGRRLKATEIIRLCRNADGVIAGTEIFTRRVMQRLRGVTVISRCGVGVENIDMAAARALGIRVFNTPEAPTAAVAELTIGLLLDCLRGISQSDRGIRQREWPRPMGELLKNKIVGIVGFGRIGRAVTRLVKAFGVEVLAHDTAPFSAALGARPVTFKELIAQSDIISLHVPADRDKGHLITAQTIESMKGGVFFLNTSRGELVDERALYKALLSKKIAAAGIDTFSREPYTGKLLQLDNVVLTSHIGSYAREARVAMERQAVDNLLRGLRKRRCV